MNCKKRCVKYFALYWRSIIAVLVPLLLTPVFLINNSKETKCLYVVLIMIIFWLTEALPLAVTSLIPIGLFPLLEVESTANVCKMYAHETVILFLGTLIIALSVEVCNLHKRIALKVMCCVKCSHRRLQFGFMAVSMFLSMWMPNFAVVAMLSPICLAILEKLETQGISKSFESTNQEEIETDSDEMLIYYTNENRRPTSITICYFLGITYAASLGGCGSIFGTATNLTFRGIYESYFPDQPKIDFLRFLAYGSPIMLLNTILTWIWMQLLYMGLFRPKSKDAVAIFMSDEDTKVAKDAIKIEYTSMGELTVAEVQVVILLILLAVVWIFRAPYFTSRWNPYFSGIVKHDASPTIIFIIFLFMLPSKWSCFNFCRRNSDNLPKVGSHSLITWPICRHKVPWGLVFLFGAGFAIGIRNIINEPCHEFFIPFTFAIAHCGNESGMSAMIGKYLIFLEKIPKLAMLFIVCLICQILTEFSTNVAMANIIMPVLAELCKKIKIHPLYLMFPAALTTSMAFHTLAGTPGNAFVANLVNIPKKAMFVCGIGPSIITLCTYWSSFFTYGALFYEEMNTLEWTKANRTFSFRGVY